MASKMTEQRNENISLQSEISNVKNFIETLTANHDKAIANARADATQDVGQAIADYAVDSEKLRQQLG